MMANTSREVDFAIAESEVKLTDRLLGEGAFASVFEAKWQGNRVAVKCIHERYRDHDRSKQIAKPDGKDRVIDASKSLRKEFGLRCKLGHPQIVQLFGVMGYATSCHIGLVMEFMDVSLYDQTRKDPTLSSCTSASSILRDVTSAVTFLHSRAIIHRDISPRNILLSHVTPRGWIAKLSDFASAKSVGTNGYEYHSATTGYGNFFYLPKEAVRLLHGASQDAVLEYGPAIDIFSIGAVGLYSVLRVDPEDKPACLSKIGPDHPLQEVFKACLSDDPRKRPSAEELQNSLEIVIASLNCVAFGQEENDAKENSDVVDSKSGSPPQIDSLPKTSAKGGLLSKTTSVVPAAKKSSARRCIASSDHDQPSSKQRRHRLPAHWDKSSSTKKSKSKKKLEKALPDRHDDPLEIPALPEPRIPLFLSWYEIGDIVWVKRKKRFTPFWPAMVVYVYTKFSDGIDVIFFGLTPQRLYKVHHRKRVFPLEVNYKKRRELGIRNYCHDKSRCRRFELACEQAVSILHERAVTSTHCPPVASQSRHRSSKQQRSLTS